MESVLLDKEPPIAYLTLNRPEKRNALAMQVMEDVIAKLDIVAADDSVNVVIIRANGPVFSAGHDLGEMSGNLGNVDFMRKTFFTCNTMMLRIHALPQPVIAQVQGIATAAGCQLVAACDLAIAETGARFATPGVKIGLFCTTPMVPLVRVIGRRRAMEMLLTGRFISADEALHFGLLNRIVEQGKLAEETRNWAMQIAEASRFTLSLGKQAFYSEVDLSEKSAYDHAGEVITRNSMAEDAREGMSAFLQKRKPQWHNR